LLMSQRLEPGLYSVRHLSRPRFHRPEKHRGKAAKSHAYGREEWPPPAASRPGESPARSVASRHRVMTTQRSSKVNFVGEAGLRQAPPRFRSATTAINGQREDVGAAKTLRATSSTPCTRTRR
jgi:hypothetical protein